MTADVPAGERQALYAARAALFVTTRILVVDLLSGRLHGDQIAGMLVLNAHRWVGGRVGGPMCAAAAGAGLLCSHGLPALPIQLN